MSESNRQIVTFDRPGALATYLDKAKGEIARALPKHLNPDRMLRLAVTCFSTTPKLRECSGQSILASIVVASQLGLEPGVAGQGYLVPYKGTCTFVPGWKGLVGLLNNTGKATSWTGAAYEGDKFTYRLGSNPSIDHEPGPNYGDPDKITHFYACGKVNGAELPVIECWTKERVIKHRNKYNKVGNAHYSFNHFEMYGRKVVLLQVLKYMPCSIELGNALDVADANEANRFVKMDGDIVVVEDMPDGAAGDEPEALNPGPGTREPSEPASPKSKPSLPPAADPATKGKIVVPDDKLRDALQIHRTGAGISSEELYNYCVANNILRAEQGLQDISLPRIRIMLDGWNDVQDAIVRARSATP